jgi:hypothetical protein
VILVDAYLLLYAYDKAAKEYGRARTWLEQKFSSSENIGLSWLTILALPFRMSFSFLRQSSIGAS